MKVDLVVLLGAPTSGKSTLGRLLAARYGWRWCEWELELLRDWGDRENLIANKVIALAQLHDRVRTLAAEPGPPVVYESTGLSDGEYLDRHERELTCLVVRLDVGRGEMLRRRHDRPPGEHLTDAEELTREIWSAFTAVVVPSRSVDLVVDTETTAPEGACDLIYAAVEAMVRDQSRS